MIDLSIHFVAADFIFGYVVASAVLMINIADMDGLGPVLKAAVGIV